MAIKEDLTAFQRLTGEEKRQICLDILSGVKDEGTLFSDLYTLVESSNATEKDYYEIYESSLEVLYKKENENIEDSLKKLEEMKEKLLFYKEQEKIELLKEREEAELLINSL